MRGLSLADLAAAVGCARSYLSQIENGANAGRVSGELLAAIERALAMRPGDLAERAAWRDAPEPIRRHVAGMARRDRAAQQLAQMLASRGLDALYRSGELGALVEQLSPGTGGAPAGADGPAAAVAHGEVEGAPLGLPLEIPLINAVTAGGPAEFTDLGYPARVADAYVRSPDVRDPDAFACRVIGDSMLPDYRAGDIVIFSPARPVHDGLDCFVRFERDAESTFKRVYFDPPVPGAAPGAGPPAPGAPAALRIRLQPLNPAFEARTLAREDVAGLYAAVSVIRKVP